MRSKSGHKAVAEKSASSGALEFIKTIVYAVLIALGIRTIAYEPFNIPSGSMVPTLLVGDYLFVSKFSYGYSRYSLPFGLPLFAGRITVPVLSHLPQRGDVIVFKVPTDNSTDFIKRVVGLPGDRIQMIHGDLFINGQKVPRQPDAACRNEESGVPVPQQFGYVESLPRGAGEAPVAHCIIKWGDDGQFDNTPVFTVPAGHYFMMGDNRDNSDDSRAAFSNNPSDRVPCTQNRPDALCYVPAENLVGQAQFIFFSTNGEAAWWQPWDWPYTIRYGRLFHGVH
jgi:signal peptidase I